MAQPDLMERDTQVEDLQAAFAQQPAALPVATGGAPLVAVDQAVTARHVEVRRDEARVLEKIRIQAAVAGERWYYRFPVQNKKGQDWIEGPSIKCATAVARLMGNCHVDVRAIDHGTHWMLYAKFVDLETGFNLVRPYQQAKNWDHLRKWGQDRALDIVFQVAASKATRNVICNALETFTDFAFEEAKGALVEKIGKQLDGYRAKVLDRLAKMRIDVHRVEQTLGRPADAWLAADVARLIAEIQACNDGMSHPDQLWPGAVPTERPKQPAPMPSRAARRTTPPAQPDQPAPEAEPAAPTGEVKLWVLYDAARATETFPRDQPRDAINWFAAQWNEAFPPDRGMLAMDNHDTLLELTQHFDKDSPANNAINEALALYAEQAEEEADAC